MKAHWVRAADADSFAHSQRVVIGDREIALFRIDAGVYALDDICSHEYARLSEGEIWDDAVYCPKHGSRFDIRTGEVTGLPAIKGVRSIPVKLEADGIYVDLADEA